METQSRTISLVLYGGDPTGIMRLEDPAWASGRLFCAPRGLSEDLLETGACKTSGVYLLVSQRRALVGRSSKLLASLARHMVEMPWWDRLVVLTTDDDSLDDADVDYLQSALIREAMASGAIAEAEEGTVRNSLGSARKKLLDQYIDGALLLMQLVGIRTFRSKGAGRGASASANDSDVGERLAFGTRTKRLAIDYARGHGFAIGKNVNYAKLGEGKSVCWINPYVSYLSLEWHVILNNTQDRELIVMRVPAGSLHVRKGAQSGLLVRADNPSKLDLHIGVDDLVDHRSGVDFSPFFVGRVAY